MITVRCDVRVLEVDGKDVWYDAPEYIIVDNGRTKKMAVLTVGGKQYTIWIDDLKAALENAQNTSALV
jgi:hypothetical protein